MQFALENGTTAQLQICSSARNVSLLPVHRENYKKNYGPLCLFQSQDLQKYVFQLCFLQCTEFDACTVL